MALGNWQRALGNWQRALANWQRALANWQRALVMGSAPGRPDPKRQAAMGPDGPGPG